MTKDEIRAAIRARLEETGDLSYYCEEMTVAGGFLQKTCDIIPEALPRVAIEFQWVLQHNVDSYGCDWEWVYNDDPKYGGMACILNDQFYIPGWAKDRTLYDMEFGLV